MEQLAEGDAGRDVQRRVDARSSTSSTTRPSSRSTRAAQLAEIAIPGLDSPLQQFVRGQTEKLTVDLFFDTTEDGTGAGATSVTTQTDQIYALVKIEPAGTRRRSARSSGTRAFPGADSAARRRQPAAQRVPVRRRERQARSSRSSAPRACRCARR